VIRALLLNLFIATPCLDFCYTAITIIGLI
jgi:hypothetical protein